MDQVLRSFRIKTKDGRDASVRETLPGDFEGHIAAIRAVALERPRTLMVQESELWDRDRFIANIIPWGPTGARLVIELEGSIVGGFSIHRRSGMLASRHVASFGIFLCESGRGLGLGKQLLEICELWAIEQGVSRIEMPVFAHNERAQRLYLAAGYQIEGYERQAVSFPEGWVDEIRMAKLL